MDRGIEKYGKDRRSHTRGKEMEEKREEEKENQNEGIQGAWNEAGEKGRQEEMEIDGAREGERRQRGR